MAVVTISTDVELRGSGSSFERIQFGEAVTKGQLVYRKAADGKYWLAQADDASTAEVTHLVSNGGLADAWGYGAKTGNRVDPGAGTTITEKSYYLSSATAGAYGDFSDLGSGDSIVLVGSGLQSDEIETSFVNSGYTVP